MASGLRLLCSVILRQCGLEEAQVVEAEGAQLRGLCRV
jgi:hypothetical protein